MDNNETQREYLKSLEIRGLQEQIYINSFLAENLQEINEKKAHTSSIAHSIKTGDSEDVDAKIKEINEYVGQDNIKINDSSLSIGTIIRRAAMKKNLNASLDAGDTAFVECGMNGIIDLTRGTLANQHHEFSKEDWGKLKDMFPPPATNDEMINARPTLKKIKRVFKDCSDVEECYWHAKMRQRRSSRRKNKVGYELVSIILDKMIKHEPIFSLSKPTPSEADIIIKVWSDLFEALLQNKSLYIRWSEKGLPVDNGTSASFKLNAKIVLVYNNKEYPVSSVEFAPFAGPKNNKMDRSKLLLEAKTIYNDIIGLNINEEHADDLTIVSIQIIGLEAHIVSVKLEANELYVANTVRSFTLPSTVTQLKKNCKGIIDTLFDIKSSTLYTAETIKQTLNNKK